VLPTRLKAALPIHNEVINSGLRFVLSDTKEKREAVEKHLEG
jgi:hypothetical protein